MGVSIYRLTAPLDQIALTRAPLSGRATDFAVLAAPAEKRTRVGTPSPITAAGVTPLGQVTTVSVPDCAKTMAVSESSPSIANGEEAVESVKSATAASGQSVVTRGILTPTREAAAAARVSLPSPLDLANRCGLQRAWSSGRSRSRNKLKGRPVMRYATAALIVLGVGIATVHQSGTALAQATSQGQPPAPAPSAGPAAAPASPVTTVPTLKAKDLEGLDAFGSDGQQVGKVVKVNVLPDGNVKDAEIHSSGFFGFFSTAYIVPADKLSVKGGRAAISMTSEEVKKLTK